MKTLLFGICALAAVASTSRAQAQSYALTDLGTLGGTFSQANGVNNSGQVVGSSTNAAGLELPFLYSGGVMQPVGTQPGTALGINNAGLLTGAFYTSPTVFTYNGAFSSTGGSATPIPGFVAGTAVNNLGQILVRTSNGGQGTPGNEGTSSIVFGGVAGPAAPLAGLALNDVGTIGGFYVPTFRQQAAIYAGGIRTDFSGFFAQPNNYISGINNAGQLIANSQITTINLAYFYSGGSARQIPSLPFPSGAVSSDFARGLNNFGLVVGSSRTTSSAPGGLSNHAFLYDGTNTFDLNNLIAAGSGWELNSANAISDTGYIVGYGTIGGVQHAFLLTPIPEPSTLAACATLGAGVLAWRRRRRP